jgi:hypothetical protein
VPFPPLPIPAEFLPPVTNNELSLSAWIVIFEFNEHSIPAFPAPIEEIVFVPVLTMVAELAEIVMDEVVVTLMFWRTILIVLLVTSTLYAVELPVTTTVSTGS